MVGVPHGHDMHLAVGGGISEQDANALLENFNQSSSQNLLTSFRMQAIPSQESVTNINTGNSVVE